MFKKIIIWRCFINGNSFLYICVFVRGGWCGIFPYGWEQGFIVALDFLLLCVFSTKAEQNKNFF